MSELRRRYEIDNHLGRHAKALKSLHALHEYDELKLYTIKHVLYREALELYKYQTDLLRDMTQLYADYLYDQSKYQEAAIGKILGYSNSRRYFFRRLTRYSKHTNLLGSANQLMNPTRLRTCGKNVSIAQVSFPFPRFKWQSWPSL